MNFEARGVRGVLGSGTQTAAMLGAWRLTTKPEAIGVLVTTLHAERVAVDPFWITQEPFVVWLDLDAAWWGWRHIEVLSDTTYRLHGDPDIREGQWVNHVFRRLT